jgi:hypothetical protein
MAEPLVRLSWDSLSILQREIEAAREALDHAACNDEQRAGILAMALLAKHALWRVASGVSGPIAVDGPAVLSSG